MINLSANNLKNILSESIKKVLINESFDLTITVDEWRCRSLEATKEIEDAVSRGENFKKYLSEFHPDCGDGWHPCRNRFKEWNWINDNGELKTPTMWFDYTSDFEDGIAYVTVDAWGGNFMSPEGKLISPLWFQQIYLFNQLNDEYALVKYNDKWNWIDKKGNLLSKIWLPTKPENFDENQMSTFFDNKGKEFQINSLGKITPLQKS